MTRTRRHLLATSVVVVFAAATTMTAAASTAPGLGTATSFAVLAGTTVTNTGSTIVTGDLGVSPGTAVTGFGSGAGTLHGTQHTGTDALAVSAKNDLTTAYGVAASSPCNFNQTGANLGGQTLTPGTYCQTTAPTLTGTLTLSGNGVFIFQIGSTLVTAPGATVRFVNGAQPCNVFWQVGSSATLDTTTTFVGTIMALASISLNNGASIDGRALAQTGQVSMINNRITVPATCNAAAVAGPTTLATPRSAASTPTSTTAITGPPVAGGGPSQSDIPRWVLVAVAALLAGAGAIRMGVRVRTHHRRA
ncbi:MAG TPA: ice-binding family protein [Candidatus Angelobacter sp.]|jgi:hypothetical protein|nr:ice-binding family protein [Candidatus Angelobacter sp.]